MKTKVIDTYKNIAETLRFLKRHDRTYLVLLFAEILIYAVDIYPTMLMMKYAINLLERKVLYGTYLKLVLLMMAMVLLFKLLRVYVNTERPVRDQVLTEKLFKDYFVKCMQMDYADVCDTSVQEKKSMAKHLASGEIAGVGWYLKDMCANLISVLVSIGFIAYYSLASGFVVALSLLFIFAMSHKVEVRTADAQERQVMENRKIENLYSIGNSYHYAKESRLYQYFPRIIAKLREPKSKCLEIENTKNDERMRFACIEILFLILMYAVSFYFLYKRFRAQEILIGDVVFVLTLCNALFQQVSDFTSSKIGFYNTQKFINHYKEFDALNVTSEEGTAHDLKSPAICLENVSFKYPGAATYALKNISMTVKENEKISVIGMNGAGKSTLIKLILGLYRPDEGRILINGIDVREISRDRYASMMSSVFQDYRLFAFTVEENICSFRPVDERKLFETADHTMVTEFIQALPKEFKTYVSNEYEDEGVDFSEGQKQKIALARSLYRDTADLYVLDEPTSAYDAKAEARIYNSFKKHFPDKMIIFISHRLASCKLSDKIYLMDNGRVIEEGTHEELLSKNGVYRKMFLAQSEDYQ